MELVSKWNWSIKHRREVSSTVSANTTSGFSIVSYTGNGVAGATVGHGLGVAPSAILC
jgi:hypothetical protein